MQQNTNINQLLAQFPKYKDPNRIRTDVMNVWRHSHNLQPKRGKLTLNTGQESQLLMLEGTFPIVYRAAQYFTPIEIYITENYPASPPMCYIRPTPGMSLKMGHRHVDQSGLVYLPYLHEWTARSHNLAELIANMSSVFGAEPPLFATPPGGVRPRPTPQPQPQPAAGPRAFGGGVPAAGTYGTPSSFGGGGGRGYGAGASPYSQQQQQQQPQPMQVQQRPLPPRPDPEQVRKDKEKAVTAKLQCELQIMYSALGADMDSALETQGQLEDQKEEAEKVVEELSRRKIELERLIKVSKERERELDTYLKDRKEEGEPSVDDLIEPKDPLSEQMLRLVAENAALEDALYYLDLGVTDSVITVEVFLKEIRRLARKQFVARATMKKVERAQQQLDAQRARFNAEQQQQQQQRGGGYYPHLAPQQQPAPGGYMGGPPPGYTPPSGGYRGATGYGQAAAGTANTWGVGAGAGAGATGMGYGGYPTYGGAQTTHTQRR